MPALAKIVTAATILIVVADTTTYARADQVNWSTDIESALRSANQSGRLVLMKFTADWCGYCKKMERETFTRPAVASLVNEQFVPVLVDADKHEGLTKQLKIKGLPAVLVVSPKMVILTRISGYQTEDKLLPRLNAILAQHGQTGSANSRVAQKSPAAPTRTVSRTGAPTQQVQPVQPPVTSSTGPAFGGLCLSAVNETRSLVSGRPQYSMKYRGKTLYFSSPEHLKKFQTAPQKYWPARDGVCPVTQIDGGRAVEGKLEFAAMFRSQLWVTDSAEAMNKFVAQPAHYVDALPQQ